MTCKFNFLGLLYLLSSVCVIHFILSFGFKQCLAVPDAKCNHSTVIFKL